ncbi:MAG: hypothetical protein HZA15_09175 [Nitrospirae bacterium]|nr:hypothetical protein [Nitrospirota bacterium]
MIKTDRKEVSLVLFILSFLFLMFNIEWAIISLLIGLLIIADRKKNRILISMLIVLTYVYFSGDFLSDKSVNATQTLQSANLKNTMVTSYIDRELTEGNNVVYCSTFQLAWSKLKYIVKGDVHLESEPPDAINLNKEIITSTDISPKYYLAMGGLASENIVDRINAELRAKFKDSPVQLKNDAQTPYDLIIYSYLAKELQFNKEFESLSQPIAFSSHGKISKVKAFGIREYSHKKEHDDLAKQVRLLSYKDDSDFIIKLISKEASDDIVLAVVPPEKTLLDTVVTVMERISMNGVKPIPFKHKDTLQIPKFNFQIAHQYTPLLNKHFSNKGFEKYFINTAKQDIFFKFDEKGLVLKSSAHLSGTFGVDLNKPKQLIFDKPFLIFLKENGGKYPYFAMWIDNDELLIRK